ncbi:DUF305 domain-containing protein [Tomitella fengzijianii]|uniref:DUF305 domain-containing protein n=1 Tax=Tomitella fengzijianii TaxID=2597660 RepID=A0A516X6K3_9ACTN|nr:DUF305 domain-containing protein [Tomitella fengzijianii]QDQ98702.1 DUF305 domain-containing protein [Tomitella fengzijianii]
MRTTTFRRSLQSKPVLAVSAVAVSALVLAGCGSGDADSDAAATPTASVGATAAEGDGNEGTDAAQAQFNDDDVAFVEGMYPHHAQAIEMTDMVDGRTDNADLIALAQQIDAAQGPEMDTMTTMFEQWGLPAPTADGGHDMGDMGGGHDMGDGADSSDSADNGQDQGGHEMTGMMTDEQMDQLMAASGPEFDRMWLEMMIQHHEGAVEMSQEVLGSGTNPQVQKMAQAIIDGQEAEIGQMQEMLQSGS